jgi:hypothetical protein
MLCYAMLLKRLSVLFDTPDITETDLITICNFFDNFSGKFIFFRQGQGLQGQGPQEKCRL